MEVTENQGAHLALLSSALDPFLFILVSYLTLVFTLLVWLTRSAIVDDLFSIPKKPKVVKQQLARVGFSLMATWFYMIKYMIWSYSAYLERIKLTSGELTTIPECGPNFLCLEKVAAAKLMRISSWLRDTSLFEEAWLHVVGGKLNWWWSVEICTFTVGVMAIHFRTQEKKKTIPHLWAYMLLGQAVAISVAWNLFKTAVVMRKWLLMTSKELSKVLPPQDDTTSSEKLAENDELSSLESGDDDAISSSKETTNDPPLPQNKPPKPVWSNMIIYSPPRYGDLLFSLVMVSAGLISVWRTPTSLLPILMMHLCPLLLLLPIPLPTTPVSHRWGWIVSTSSLYAIIATFSTIIRVKAHWEAWPQFHLLLPTFTSHPAQSSISADAICLTLTIVEELYLSFKSRKSPLWKFLLLLPLLGPSAVLAAFYTLEDKENQVWLESMWREMENSDEYRKKDMFVKEEFTTTSQSRSQIKKKQK